MCDLCHGGEGKGENMGLGLEIGDWDIKVGVLGIWELGIWEKKL